MFDVIILAGTAKPSELTISENVQNKAFLLINDRTMLEFVITALRQVSEVNRIAVVGPQAELTALAEKFTGLTVVPEGKNIVENVQRGAAALQAKQHFLVASADIPFLTAAAVEDFLASCRPYTADLYYPIVRRIDNEGRFPGVKRTYAKLRDGEFTGGNIFLVSPNCLERVLPRLEQFFALRKSPLRLAATLGWGFVFKFLTQRLTIAELEKRFSVLFAVDGKAVISGFPEIATDVDKPSDLLLARQQLK
ncbi:MAG: NTP transferase domain-containing protein [Firmicutes bacterium]|nr:NTP transferase domain-containing protein [Bacillota bacterium]